LGHIYLIQTVAKFKLAAFGIFFITLTRLRAAVIAFA
jgi:hypothetical protein